MIFATFEINNLYIAFIKLSFDKYFNILGFIPSRPIILLSSNFY